MSVESRNNVHTHGDGPGTVVFAHGFGCDQNMWRWVEPALRANRRTVLFDLVGCGKSDIASYDIEKYSTLHGYARDLIEIIEAFATGPVIFVGHSVSAMIGVLAANARPGLISAHVMIGPSPSYINEGAYQGGFSRADIDSLLDTLEANYLGWSSAMAPTIMGAPDHPELGVELTNSFCQTLRAGDVSLRPPCRCCQGDRAHPDPAVQRRLHRAAASRPVLGGGDARQSP
jgi:sigma-B regulation protein RsbQ